MVKTNCVLDFLELYSLTYYSFFLKLNRGNVKIFQGKILSLLTTSVSCRKKKYFMKRSAACNSFDLGFPVDIKSIRVRNNICYNICSMQLWTSNKYKVSTKRKKS